MSYFWTLKDRHARRAAPSTTTEPCGECGGEGWVDDTQDRHGTVPRVKCPRCNGAKFDPDGTPDEGGAKP